MEIKIDLSNASETVKIWLEDLFQDALNENRETISNERLWQKGNIASKTDRYEYFPLTENIETLTEYQNILENTLEQLQKTNVLER